MKILLIQPTIAYMPFYRQFPLGLGYIAAFCRDRLGVTAHIFDEQTVGPNALGDLLNRFQPDVVGISVVSQAFHRATQLAEQIRAWRNRILLVAGGPHATALPEVTLRGGFDFVVRGEGEETFAALVDTWAGGADCHAVPGLSFRGPDGETVHTADRVTGIDLDRIPSPYQDVDPSPYPLINISSSRGCPLRCAFCFNSSPRTRHRLRYRSPENVVDEIAYIKTTFGKTQFHFAEENFTSNPARAAEICDRIVNRRLGISWFAEASVNTVSRKLLGKMKSAGCRTIGFGIEAASESILRRIHKSISLDQARNAIAWCREAGIGCATFWIVGLPGSYSQQLKSIQFMKETQPDEIDVFACSVYPDTRLWNHAEAYGIHLDRNAIDWRKGLEVTGFDLDYISRDQIYDIGRRMITEMCRLGYQYNVRRSSKHVPGIKIISTFIERSISGSAES